MPVSDVRRRFTEAKLLQLVVHKGWFQETVPSQLPDRISFALIDGDLYESTRHLLPHVYERMSPGAIGMIAVYYDESYLRARGCPASFGPPG